MGQPASEGLVRPAQIGRHRDEPVGSPNDTGHGHADPDLRPDRRSPGADDGREFSEVVDDGNERRMSALTVDSNVLQDLATRSDERRGQGIDLDVEREDDGPVRDRRDEGRWATRSPDAGGAPLGDQTTRHQLPDQAADGAPGETRPPDEGGSRHRTGRMQLADDRAQVRPADGFAPESRFVANGGHGDLCSS